MIEGSVGGRHMAMGTLDQPTQQGETVVSRRSFLQWLTYGVGAIAGAAVAIPFVAYLFGARKAPVTWVTLGPVSDFPVNETRRVDFNNPIREPWDGLVARTAVYVRRENDDKAGAGEVPKFLVLAVNCAHLGCPVSWFQESGLFMCPCHGGVYYANGDRASGPPPRGLFSCVYRVNRVRGVDVLEIEAPHFPTLQDTLQPKA
jgi:menaquinol-cytochrome c reductase iron-sulfur subunit